MFDLPIKATIGGVEVVIVLASEYERLCGSGAALQTGFEQPFKTSSTVDEMLERLHARGGSRRKFLYDAEVSRFIIAKLDAMSPAAVRLACVERFGEERTPSGYAIERMSADIGEERTEVLRLKALGSEFTVSKVAP